ncbi:MAG: hypothetical protein ABW123_27870 [Cystobacter sp.]
MKRRRVQRPDSEKAVDESTDTSVQSSDVELPVHRTSQRCSQRGCTRPKFAKGVCAAHYRRIQRGQPLDTPIHDGTREEWQTVNGRVTKKRFALLQAEAKRLGFTSVYGLACEILDKWVPPPAAIRAE